MKHNTQCIEFVHGLSKLVISLSAMCILFPLSAARAQGGMGGSLGAQNVGDSNSYKHILTPGDRGEWPLSVSAGETVIVFVTSSSFDPAAQIVGAAGKVLAENDDVRPGDQDSLILYRFVTAGDYKILVKGFKSAAGGQYTLTVRRFKPIDIKRDERNAIIMNKRRVQWHRFAAAAGETLVVTARSAVFGPDTEIYAPNGEQVERENRSYNGNHTSTSVFRAETKGDYYLRVTPDNGSNGGYAVTVAPAHVAALSLGIRTERRLAAGGLDLWTFEGKAGDLIHVEASSQGPALAVSLKRLSQGEKASQSSEAGGNNEGPVMLPVDPKNHGELNALLRSKGRYQVEVAQSNGTPVDYNVVAAPAARAWNGQLEAAGKLNIGGTDYWEFDGKAGQIIRIAGNSVTFDIVLELYNSRGERVEINDDGGGEHNALLTGLLKQTGHFLVRVSSLGNGGSGTYQLFKKPDPTKPILVGSRTEGRLGSGSSDVWSFTGKAGQTVILSVRSLDFDAQVTVFGPDAVEVGSDTGDHETSDSLLSLHLPLNGVYTIWVSSRHDGGKYIVHLVDAD